MKKLFSNLKNSLRGLFIARNEHSFALEVILLLPYFVLILVAPISGPHQIICIVAYLGLLSAELFNTAIERVCNKLCPDYDRDIKDIKDISSAAVFVALLSNVTLFLSLLYLNL